MCVRFAKMSILLPSAFCWKKIWLTDKPKPLQRRLCSPIFNQCSQISIKSYKILSKPQERYNTKNNLMIWCRNWQNLLTIYLLRFSLNWPVITLRHLQQEHLHVWEMWFTMLIDHKIKKTTSSFQTT